MRLRCVVTLAVLVSLGGALLRANAGAVSASNPTTAVSTAQSSCSGLTVSSLYYAARSVESVRKALALLGAAPAAFACINRLSIDAALVTGSHYQIPVGQLVTSARTLSQSSESTASTLSPTSTTNHVPVTVGSRPTTGSGKHIPRPMGLISSFSASSFLEGVGAGVVIAALFGLALALRRRSGNVPALLGAHVEGGILASRSRPVRAKPASVAGDLRTPDEPKSVMMSEPAVEGGQRLDALSPPPAAEAPAPFRLWPDPIDVLLVRPSPGFAWPSSEVIGRVIAPLSPVGLVLTQTGLVLVCRGPLKDGITPPGQQVRVIAGDGRALSDWC